jgi:hypothetical protein
MTESSAIDMDISCLPGFWPVKPSRVRFARAFGSALDRCGPLCTICSAKKEWGSPEWRPAQQTATAGRSPLPGLGLKIVNTASQTVDWEKWQFVLGEKSALQNDLSPKELIND